ncbi:MAG: ribonuclease III domain-containing protein [Erysipelotrichia bacterium]|nr:ribonuclease III domain-containing protein [Erysipelotrichia bacterium]
MEERYKPLVLAFIGDAHYNLYVKRKLIDKYQQVNILQQQVAEFCSARFQAKLSKYLIENGIYNIEETDIFKRARNQKSHNAPKNTDIITYKISTGFEAVWGHWYLNNEEEKMAKVWEIIETIRER